MTESTPQAKPQDSARDLCPVCQRRAREVVPIVSAEAFILTGDWDTLRVTGLRFQPCEHRVRVIR